MFTIHDNRGQGLTEYLLLLILVAVVSIASVKSLGGVVKQKLISARNEINQQVVFDNQGPNG